MLKTFSLQVNLNCKTPRENSNSKCRNSWKSPYFTLYSTEKQSGNYVRSLLFNGMVTLQICTLKITPPLYHTLIGSKGVAMVRTFALPPLWHRLIFQRRCHMWVEFVVGSWIGTSYHKTFSSYYSGFPLSSNTGIFPFQIDLKCGIQCFLFLELQ